MKTILKRINWVDFFANIAAIILGIVITFTIQGVIDKLNQNEDVNSALALVKEELKGCLTDINTCAGIMDSEHYAARYLVSNANVITTCPTDSIEHYGTILVNEMILTLPSDALELLKSSSLFPKIGDNTLSLKIIRAYDQCEALATIFRRTQQIKTERISTFQLKGDVKISELVKTEEGLKLISSLGLQDGTNIRNGIPDIEEAISSIDNYLRK